MHPVMHCRGAAKTQRGFTLIEVMIAFLVMAIGLLGMVGLQNTSVKTNQSAYLRTQAMVLAFDMAERIRSNRIGSINGQYEDLAGAEDTNCNSASGCSETELAANDVFEWQAQVAAALPAGSGRVCGAAAGTAVLNEDGTCEAGCEDAYTRADPYYAIKVEWTDATTGDTQCYATKVRL